MKNYIRYTEMTQEIRDAMLHVKDNEDSASAVDFWAANNEKYTFDSSTGRFYINSFFPSFPGNAWNGLMRGYRKIAFENERIPIQADIAVTGDCHCDCWHCFRNKHGSQFLSVSELQRCFCELNGLGTCTVGITGGEPMLHPQIEDVILSIPPTMEGQLYTTGHRITKDFAKVLDNSAVTRCIVSLDHYNERIVNELRHYNKAFSDAMTAIDTLSNSDVYTAITVCVTNQLLHENELEKYLDFVSRLRINEIRIILPIPQGKLEGSNFRQVYVHAVRMIKSFKKKTSQYSDMPTVLCFCEFESSDYIGCSAGSNYISINNDGYVLPCVAVPLAFGNIKEKQLSEIYMDMGQYFHNSGTVCYGKRIGKIMARQPHLDTSVYPLPIDVSKQLASQCITNGKRAAFFDTACKACSTLV